MSASRTIHVQASIRTALALCLAAVAVTLAPSPAAAAPPKASMTAQCSVSGLSGTRWQGVKPDHVTFFWVYPEAGDYVNHAVWVTPRQTNAFVPTPRGANSHAPIGLTIELRHRQRTLLRKSVSCGV